MRTAAPNNLPEILLDRSDEKSLSAQIRTAVAQAILGGNLKPGTRLPSTRTLSKELGISRNTANAAYEQLVSEGYVECAVGGGTHVAAVVSPEVLGAGRPRRTTKSCGARLSRRGREIAKITLASDRVERRAKAIGDPALDLFPWKIWKKLVAQQIEQLSPQELGYASAVGFVPLREQIAAHLQHTRGMVVTSDRIVVVAGAQQALDLAARLLLDFGDRVLFEDPGYPGARAALLSAGAHLCPVAVDDEGMDIGSLRPAHRRARVAYVTPAHQFPLGATMALSRRLALLEWAEEHNGFILEDDYDGEFRHAGKPISAIASLDMCRRVVYIGTFSKVLFPALRLGFMVLPQEVVPQIASARGFIDRHSPVLEQATLAAFLKQGHFSRHIRHMRAVYSERRSALIAALSSQAKDLLDIYAPETGAHVIARLRNTSDRRAAEAIGAQEITIMPVSHYYAQAVRSNALLLGFANATLPGIQRSARNIARALRGLRR